MRWYTKEFRHRLGITLGLAPGSIAVLLIFTKISTSEEFYNSFGVSPNLYAITVLGLFSISIAAFLWFYLQTGLKFRTKSLDSGIYKDDEIPMIRMEFERQAVRFHDRIERLSVELNEIRTAGEEKRLAEGLLSEEERLKLVESLTRKLHSETADKVLSQLRKQITDSDLSRTAIENFTEGFGSTIDRLRAELAALTRRGNLNLVLGILTTVIGLAILGYFVFNYTSTGDPTEMISSFLPRLSLVIFIEVFAYFFLRLYKASLAKIKYFQNELTNVEAKAVALETSVILGSDTIDAVIERIASTERNNVLDKGQTTVELEQAKIQGEKFSTVIKDAISVIKQQKQGGT